MNDSTQNCPPVDLDELVKLFPTPWSFDGFAHDHPTWSDARVYAADSTVICNTGGEHAIALAKVITDAANAYLPNSAPVKPLDQQPDPPAP